MLSGLTHPALLPILFLCSALFGTSATAQTATPRLRGVAFSHQKTDGDLRSERVAASMAHLKRRVHADWIALSPTAYQQRHDDWVFL